MVTNLGFWGKFKKPILCQAPMHDITDAAFRFILASITKPDVMFTEFVSADGLCSKGQDKLLAKLRYNKTERPIVAQIFGRQPEKFYQAAKIIKKLKFDGLDINAGCPEKTIIKQGAGSALILEPDLTLEIIKAAKQGAGSLPVSIKTRIGYDKDITESWVTTLLKARPAAIILHARTAKQMYKLSANWLAIKKAVKLRNSLNYKTLIIGNGDLNSLPSARKKIKTSGADGAMIGRALLKNLWLFSGRNLNDIPLKVRLKTLLTHTKIFEKLSGIDKNFACFRKYYQAYLNGFPQAKTWRLKLMAANNSLDLEKIIKTCQ